MSNELLTKMPMDEPSFRSYLISLGWTGLGSSLLSPNRLSECLIYRALACTDGHIRVCYEFEQIGDPDPETLEEMESFLPSWHEGEEGFGMIFQPDGG